MGGGGEEGGPFLWSVCDLFVSSRAKSISMSENGVGEEAMAEVKERNSQVSKRQRESSERTKFSGTMSIFSVSVFHCLASQSEYRTI